MQPGARTPGSGGGGAKEPGWGGRSHVSPWPVALLTDLQWEDLEIPSSDGCAEAYPQMVTDDILCAGHVGDGTYTCVVSQPVLWGCCMAGRGILDSGLGPAA